MIISDKQVALFRNLFAGRTDVYGTYDPQTRKSWQVKKPVTDKVIRDHLAGHVPYGVYLLDRDRVSAVVADFDQDDTNPPISFCREAQTIGLPAYIERSKSKGYHVWVFADERRVLASKARLIVLHLLKRIQMPATEVFPKQDRLSDPKQYGNFINTPLFGRMVDHGRNVFLNEDLKPYDNQWQFLSRIQRVTESALDGIISEHRMESSRPSPRKIGISVSNSPRTGLMPCAQRMLADGVTACQRVACFRLACQLRKIGYSYDSTVDTLLAWSQRNRPGNGKSIIRPREIHSQASSAYKSQMYLSCGCADPAVIPFCDHSCPIYSAESKIPF